MADYYPLLAKAVSGLKNSTPEARHAIYERARKALLGQLRSMQPAAPESAVEREALALDEAIARLERDFLSAPPAERVPADAPAAETAAAPVASEQEAPASPPEPPPLAEPVEDEDAAAPPRETARPAAPKPEVKQGGGLRRLAIVIGALALVVAMVGFAAWKLRDRPEDLARRAPATDAADQQSGGKSGERIGADGRAQAPGGAGAPNLAVAYRAAILVQAPDEPGGIKTYIGSVVWRRDSSNRGPNQQLAGAIRAEVDVPTAKFNMSMVMEKNYETALSVSHTITIRFDPAADSPIGAVKAINMPEMRRDDAPKGAPLLGLPVEIASNVFLVGLASASETQNIELLQGPNWIDIPMSLASGRIAKVTFEKGVGGEKLFADVLAEWKAQQSQ
ncbi:hypothetical protein [Rhodoblastus sp.]|uniref:hypothetical protein n=1 Tax=Rhodoblastus sp. TaxID=1962975 RepID=UPI003F9C0071